LKARRFIIATSARDVICSWTLIDRSMHSGSRWDAEGWKDRIRSGTTCLSQAAYDYRFS
jgi:hypothetical protein